MDRSEKALEYFDNKFNCAQSVLTAFANELGLSEDESLRVSCAFGGGIGRPPSKACRKRRTTWEYSISKAKVSPKIMGKQSTGSARLPIKVSPRRNIISAWLIAMVKA